MPISASISISQWIGEFHTSTPCSKPKNHYDGLVFSVIRPHFSEHHYNADGMQTTKLQHKQLEADKSTNMADDSGLAESEGGNSLPVTKIAEVTTYRRAY
jgi:hypothetical protein